MPKPEGEKSFKGFQLKIQIQDELYGKGRKYKLMAALAVPPHLKYVDQSWMPVSILQVNKLSSTYQIKWTSFVFLSLF